jgi:drug/metabolite transporter (DMT)-like permease
MPPPSFCSAWRNSGGSKERRFFSNHVDFVSKEPNAGAMRCYDGLLISANLSVRGSLLAVAGILILGRKVSDAASAAGKNYRLGTFYSVAASLFLATQEPFSSLAAKRLSPAYFVCLTQVALLLSIPLLILTAAKRRDFFALLSNFSNLWRLAVLFAIGLCGLLLYNLGLSDSNPIVIAAILNLSPFWAALVALVLAKKPIPVSPLIFFGCLVLAFLGAMVIAWSQTNGSDAASWSEIGKAMLHGSWLFAIPIPILYALSGTLVRQWFSQFEESSAIAANFLVSGAVLIPASLVVSRVYPTASGGEQTLPAILLLLIGTLIAASAGRVFYQIALSRTDNDNGFVTMFFLSVPGLTSLVSLPLSWWIPDLRFIASPLFFTGLFVVAAPLLFFSLRSFR